MLPYGQDEAKAVSRSVATNLENELKAALLDDPWLFDNPSLLTKQDGLAWHGSKLYVPQTLRSRVFHRCQNSKQAGHYGFLKTLHLARHQFWWPQMRTDVETYVRGCPVCATSKPHTGKPLGLLQSADPIRPWQDIVMDFIVELPESRGYMVIWTVVDLFSKQAHFIPCKGLPSARRLARLFLTHIYHLHRVSHHIISDRGVQFTARFWREFVHFLRSSQGVSSAYHPSTNGAAEWVNATVEQYLRSYVSHQQTIWVDLVVFAEVAYNNAVHSSTSFTPFQVVYGRDFVPIPEYSSERSSSCQSSEWLARVSGVWGIVRKTLAKARDTAKVQADKKRRAQKPFQVGDLVYLSTKYIQLRVPCKKLAPKYIGPFRIAKVINLVAVRLHLPRFLGRIHSVFHSSLLKPVEEVSHDHLTETPGPVVHDQCISCQSNNIQY
ncbi:hypothetical protein NXF25_019067 [Crotalus adamanteus]|uniref:Gypsy retrotransposon integrase-like protein 1 n=1 Tax=Crotalus adamanteus TaxID=8729 RepID=A0AAW1B287_CROAD